MDSVFPMLFAGIVGFSHAFEADHLVAVSSLVTKRDRIALAIKDGIYWGLGHSSTIFLIGLVIIIGRVTFLDGLFSYFEATVGLMLIVIGAYRLINYYKISKPAEDMHHKNQHRLAYGVGLIHGLAGSGAMVLLVMSEIKDEWSSMLYLVIFGLGSILGMLVAAGIFSLPFSRRVTQNKTLQAILIWLSSLLCIGYGIYVLIENLHF